MLYRIISQIAKKGTSILCRIDAPDLDKVPMRGPLIAYSNHTGQIEVAVLFAHLQPRLITGWAKTEAWDNPFFR
jgi:1-acyl-sn-glycerol-3-phosphate acyltransferase